MAPIRTYKSGKRIGQYVKSDFKKKIYTDKYRKLAVKNSFIAVDEDDAKILQKYFTEDNISSLKIKFSKKVEKLKGSFNGFYIGYKDDPDPRQNTHPCFFLKDTNDDIGESISINNKPDKSADNKEHMRDIVSGDLFSVRISLTDACCPYTLTKFDYMTNKFHFDHADISFKDIYDSYVANNEPFDWRVNLEDARTDHWKSFHNARVRWEFISAKANLSKQTHIKQLDMVDEHVVRYNNVDYYYYTLKEDL